VYVAAQRGQRRQPLNGFGAWNFELVSQCGQLDWIAVGVLHYLANTETDEAGRFFLCRVDYPSVMLVSAGVPGYEPYEYGQPISGTGDRSFEFEFRR
jgi:hypothetical protein